MDSNGLNKKQRFFKNAIKEFDDLFEPGAAMNDRYAALFAAYVQASATLDLAEAIKGR